MMAVFVLVLVLLVGLFIRSAKEPVSVLGLYKIDNYNVVRLRNL